MLHVLNGSDQNMHKFYQKTVGEKLIILKGLQKILEDP